MRHYFKYILIISLALSQRYPSNIDNLNKIGDNNFPGNPLNDRAKGYILDGKIKSTILNYGNFIDWAHWQPVYGESMPTFHM